MESDTLAPPRPVRESDLYAPVRDWLIAAGYEVHVEVLDHDIIAVKDGRYVVVELKLCWSGTLINQLIGASRWADEVWGAVASNPLESSLRHAKSQGWGVLQIAGGKARKRVGAKPQPWERHRLRAYREKKLSGRAPAMPHELAGLPACALLRAQRRARSQRNVEVQS